MIITGVEMNEKIEILEDLESKRRTMLLGFIIFFGMWQLGTIGTWYLKEILPHFLFVFFGVILMIGSIGWIWVSYLLLKISKVFKQNPEFCQIVDDERNCNLKYKASHYGLLATGVLSMTLYLIFLLGGEWFNIDFSTFSGQFVAHLIWVFAILSSGIAYYNLSKEE